MLACSLDTDLNYVTTMLQSHTYMDHQVNLQQLLGGRCFNFSGVFS